MNTEHGNDADYRLPHHVLPTRYSLRVAPDFETASFEGEVAIELSTSESTTEITCNATDLEIASARLLSPDGTEMGLEVTLDSERERVTFVAPHSLEPASYVLKCSFTGPLGDKLRGFYRSTFKDDAGGEGVIASTHFEATDARRAFPCFDEPEMKAVFSISLDVPGGLFAVSNSPELETTDLGDGKRRVLFEDTMKMSTYLVAYAVGPFEATEAVIADGSVPLRVVVPQGKLHLTAFALEAAAHALSWFHQYFDIAYPAQKLDLVAIPDFAMGAMENLGCVTFREQDLLCDPAQSSIPELSRIAEVVDHEIAHMWFGDLVTMKWWNGIWLNEAFATFMSLSCLDDFRPEWNRWVMFGTEKDMALQIDGLHSTRAIEFPVRAPDEAEAMFDHLTYLKGGNVLRMVEQYLGMERFRDGVRAYLKVHAYGNTETTDLWDAIEAASDGEPVRALLDSWIFQGGSPLVTAGIRDGEVELRAQPFAYLPADERPPGAAPSAIGRDWLVPIRYEDRPGKVIASLLGPGPSGADPLKLGPPAGLAVANAGGSGTYRLSYEGELFEQVLSRLSSLEPLERFNLVADSWACTLGQLAGLGDFLAVVRHLRDEADPNVWGVVAGAMGLLDLAAAGSAEPELSAFTRAVFGPELQRLGFEVGRNDSPEQQRSRSIFIGLLGTIGADEPVRTKAREAFRSSQLPSSGSAHPIPASVAQSVLNVVVFAGGREEFEAVREGFANAPDPLSEIRHLYALTATRDPESVRELLEMTRNVIRTQDAHTVLLLLLRNRHAALATWEFVKEHFDELERRLPSHAMPRVVGGVSMLVKPSKDESDALVHEVRQYLANREFGGRQRLIDQAIERQAINARFVTRHSQGIGELLAKS
ncbi:MAG: M1 family metallopeptidase [Acidimicrobiales bacterium]